MTEGHELKTLDEIKRNIQIVSKKLLLTADFRVKIGTEEYDQDELLEKAETFASINRFVEAYELQNRFAFTYLFMRKEVKGLIDNLFLLLNNFEALTETRKSEIIEMKKELHDIIGPAKKAIEKAKKQQPKETEKEQEKKPGVPMIVEEPTQKGGEHLY